MKTLALLHTTAVTVPFLTGLAREILPGIRLINLLDDSLLPEVMAAGGVTGPVETRLRAYLAQAAVAGADGVLCCCSSVGEAFARAADSAPLPGWRIDEPMAQEAAGHGGRIGVLATVASTLAPTAELIARHAAAFGRPAQIEPCLVAGAYEALRDGRPAEHDRLVLEALGDLRGRCTVAVLAQASMARLAPSIPPGGTPVLTSPSSGLRAAGRALGVATA